MTLFQLLPCGTLSLVDLRGQRPLRRHIRPDYCHQDKLFGLSWNICIPSVVHMCLGFIHHVKRYTNLALPCQALSKCLRVGELRHAMHQLSHELQEQLTWPQNHHIYAKL